MNDFQLIDLPAKKVYYVLTYTGFSSGRKIYVSDVDSAGHFIPNEIGNTGSLAAARKFASVSAVLRLLRESSRKVPVFTEAQIVRVEETPGEARRVLLKDCEGCPEGATVKYAFQNPYPENDKFFVMDEAGCGYSQLHQNPILVDAAKIETTILNHPNRQLRGPSSPNRLVRIAILPALPTITETVLS